MMVGSRKYISGQKRVDRRGHWTGQGIRVGELQSSWGRSVLPPPQSAISHTHAGTSEKPLKQNKTGGCKDEVIVRERLKALKALGTPGRG